MSIDIFEILQDHPIAGVRYNVIRRPLSGGKGQIKRHEAKELKSGFVPAETFEHFYGRVAQYIIDEPEHYFMRWQVDVTEKDVARFRKECLDPILEQLCHWYDYIIGCVKDGHSPFDPMGNKTHWRHPFGASNSIDEYGWSDIDYFLQNGETAGMRRVDKLFTELQ